MLGVWSNERKNRCAIVWLETTPRAGDPRPESVLRATASGHVKRDDLLLP